MTPRYDLDDADVGQYDEPVWLREDEADEADEDA